MGKSIDDAELANQPMNETSRSVRRRSWTVVLVVTVVVAALAGFVAGRNGQVDEAELVRARGDATSAAQREHALQAQIEDLQGLAAQTARFCSVADEPSMSDFSARWSRGIGGCLTRESPVVAVSVLFCSSLDKPSGGSSELWVQSVGGCLTKMRQATPGYRSAPTTCLPDQRLDLSPTGTSIGLVSPSQREC